MNIVASLILYTADSIYKNQQQLKKSQPPEKHNPKTSITKCKEKVGGREISYEKRIKGLIEKKYQRQFFKVRPAWLTNPETKRCLELDIYCKDLKLAFEIQDRSHFEFIPFYHKTEDAFQKQQQRDELKRKLCQQHGVTLISIDTRLIHPSFTDDEIWEIILQAFEK